MKPKNSKTLIDSKKKYLDNFSAKELLQPFGCSYY